LSCPEKLGFQPGVGCSYAHLTLLSILHDTYRNKYDIHLCAFDISKAFNFVKHFQQLDSLFSSDIDIYVIFPSEIPVLVFIS